MYNIKQLYVRLMCMGVIVLHLPIFVKWLRWNEVIHQRSRMTRILDCRINSGHYEHLSSLLNYRKILSKITVRWHKSLICSISINLFTHVIFGSMCKQVLTIKYYTNIFNWPSNLVFDKCTVLVYMTVYLYTVTLT